MDGEKTLDSFVEPKAPGWEEFGKWLGKIREAIGDIDHEEPVAPTAHEKWDVEKNIEELVERLESVKAQITVG